MPNETSESKTTKNQWPIAYQESDKLAIAIARKIFPNDKSEQAMDLAKLLCDFADEIIRRCLG